MSFLLIKISKNNKTHWLTDEPVSIRQKGDYQVPTIFDGYKSKIERL